MIQARLEAGLVTLGGRNVTLENRSLRVQ
jgi:hypothetical protein